jgi:hypothetical protein
MSKKMITISQLADELQNRLNNNRSVDCCKTELMNLARIAKQKIGNEMIEVNWQD